MTQDDKLFIIDAYGFIFRAYHAQKELKTSSGFPVNAIYGFTSMLMKVLSDFNPKYLVAVFDGGGKNFRHDMFPDYKANRPSAPEDLKIQFPIAREVVDILGIKHVERYGFEADDLIATIASKYKDRVGQIVIISSDKDLMQLIDDKVCFYDALKQKYIKSDDVVEKFGVLPVEVLDYLAIVGDSSDNIPGVKGLGPKAAVELIKEYGNIDSILLNLDNIKPDRRRNLIIENRENAILSRDLASLKRDVEILDMDFLHNIPDDSKLVQFLKKYEFNSLVPRMNKLFETKLNINREFTEILEINSSEALNKILHSLIEQGFLLFYVNEDEIHFSAKNLYISYRIAKNYELAKEFCEFLKINSVKKITFNLKSVLHFFDSLDLNLDSIMIDDILLMYYVANGPITADNKLDSIYQNILKKNFDGDIKLISEIYEELLKKLITNNNYTIYNKVDLPLSRALFEMEKVGILTDKNLLSKISEDLLIELKGVEKNIFALTGEEFNVASTKQLGEILFDKLKLPFGKISTKSKNYSTSIEILEKLSEAGFIIADYLIDHREISKIKNTYADGLQNYINPKTNRIHTTFNQTYTNTARLSSSNPNLQNIPIRSERGAKIRGAFIAEKGNKIISADYSQVELRILAEIANVTHLKEAFENNIDVHVSTASKVFKIHSSLITKDQRRKAKAINFGIIYGISSFGLSKQLGISVAEAKTYIDSYFNEYPEILDYMEKIKFFAKKNGYVNNAFGRRCYIQGINDKNPAIRNFAERAAINAPIQGTASDICRMAMNKVFTLIKQEKYNAKMILQIHDEILFEAKEENVEQVIAIIKPEMENVVKMSVPFLVDISVGNDLSK